MKNNNTPTNTKKDTIDNTAYANSGSLDLSNNSNQADEIYLVERIVSHKTHNNRCFYLIKWKGYSDKDNTWEDEKNLDCEQLLNDYWTQYNKSNNINNNSGKKSKKNNSMNGSSSALNNNKKNPNNTKEGIPSENDNEQDWNNKLDKIISIKKHNTNNPSIKNNLSFKLQWKNGLISEHKSEIVNKKVPMMVLKFYESHLMFTSEE